MDNIGIECWRCGNEGSSFVMPSHPDGGGLICDDCHQRMTGPTERPDELTINNLTDEQIAELVREDRR